MEAKKGVALFLLLSVLAVTVHARPQVMKVTAEGETLPEGAIEPGADTVPQAQDCCPAYLCRIGVCQPYQCC